MVRLLVREMQDINLFFRNKKNRNKILEIKKRVQEQCDKPVGIQLDCLGLKISMLLFPLLRILNQFVFPLLCLEGMIFKVLLQSQ